MIPSPKPRTEAEKNRFTYDEQVEIVKQIAIHRQPKDIIDSIGKKFGKRLTSSNLSHYATRPQWQPMIEKFREEFEAKISDEDLASKRRRVQELTNLYRRLESTEKEENLSRAANMLSLIREEIEGKASQNMQITQYNQYNGLSDEELRKFVAENNRFIEIAEKKKKAITLNKDGEVDG